MNTGLQTLIPLSGKYSYRDERGAGTT